ncbi:hypothetical protein [Microbacterium sp. H1-D42]|uniref:hypothetical protein n=1 Tax=Microbacterium sp. H1-D42 TaxID=2925844 RepID=UPI001F53AEF1|nr:hypothetical protein [Microbacterium sp. H1-D42]UNK69303.1 hypothetical protein MNR00_08825 [Microbacterium sp. H1-D42]
MFTPVRRRLGALAASSIVFVAVLTGCTAPAPEVPPARDATPTSAPTPQSPSAEEPAATVTPEAAFRAWLAASREPDAVEACGYFTDELAERMLTEMRASGFPVADCLEMINVTAQAYAATGASMEVDIETIEHTPQNAELFVTYPGNKCGSIVMLPHGDSWIMTENSEQMC